MCELVCGICHGVNIREVDGEEGAKGVWCDDCKGETYMRFQPIKKSDFEKYIETEYDIEDLKYIAYLIIEAQDSVAGLADERLRRYMSNLLSKTRNKIKLLESK